jgi:DNA-binding transcriptional LysR family regulator
LYRDPFYLAVPKTHRLASETAVTLDMIKDETIILMSNESNPGFFGLVQKLYLSRGLTPLLNATSNDRMASIMMMRIGMGLTLLTKQFLKVYDFDDIVHIPIAEDDAFHNIGVAYRREATSELAEQFLRELWDYAEASPFTV